MPKTPKNPPTFNLGDGPSPEPTQQPEPPQETLLPESPPTNPTVGPSSADALPDFETAPIPPDENKAEAVSVGEGMDGKVTATGRMTYEVFDQTFCAIFSISGGVTGFRTLAAAPELPTRPAATQAMYETILDTPALHFLLNPQGVWMQRAFAMGMFFVPVVKGVAEEMQGRRNPPRSPDDGGSAPTMAMSDVDRENAMRDAVRGK